MPEAAQVRDAVGIEETDETVSDSVTEIDGVPETIHSEEDEINGYSDGDATLGADTEETVLIQQE